MKKISIKLAMLTGILMMTVGHAYAYLSTGNTYGDISVPCNSDGTPNTVLSPGDNTVCVQVAGASAPKSLGAELALDFLTTSLSNTTIYHYIITGGATPLGNPPSFSATNGMVYTVGSGDLNVWTGVGNSISGASGKPIILSFAALHSMDGYGRLACQNSSSYTGIQVLPPQTYYTDYCASGANYGLAIPMSSAPGVAYNDTSEPQIDFANTTCTTTTQKNYVNYAGNTIPVTELSGCSNAGVRMMATTVGASDVLAGTYNNTGPSLAFTHALTNAPLTNAPSFFIPFQLAVTSTLIYTNPKTGVQQQGVLSRDQVQSLFNNPSNIPTWSKIPGFDGNTQKVFVCMRLAGSGTKANFNSNLMKGVAEYTNSLYQGGANYAFNFTGTDMKNCITSPPAGYAAIGYINADSLPAYPSSLGSSGSLNGIALEGVLPHNDPNYTDAKATVRDMVYPYMTQEQLVTRTAGDPAIDADQTSFIAAFESAAVNGQYLVPPPSGGIFAAGAFWVAPGDMCAVRSNTDQSPFTMKLATTANGATCPIK